MEIGDKGLIIRRGLKPLTIPLGAPQVGDKVICIPIGNRRDYVAIPLGAPQVGDIVALLPEGGTRKYVAVPLTQIDVEGMWDLCLGTLAGDPYTKYCNDHPYNSPPIYWTRSGCASPPAGGRGVWSISGTESARAAFVSYIVWAGINTTNHELRFQWKGSMSSNHPTTPLYFYIIYWESGNVYYKLIASAILGSDVNQSTWKNETITYNSGGSTIINLGFVIYSYISGLPTYTLTFDIDVRYVDDVTT